MKIRRLYLIIFCLSISSLSFAQNINVNDKLISSYLRAIHTTDSSVSKSISTLISPIRYSHFENQKDKLNQFIGPTKGPLALSLLSPQINFISTSHRPSRYNKGNLLPTRGNQLLFSSGIYLKRGPIELQVRPEFYFAENRNYDGFDTNHFDIVWLYRYLWWNKIDTPEWNNLASTSKILPGQSYLRINFGLLSAVLSTENLWWGPGRRNSLIMSDNAPGFTHLRLETSKPIKTKIGTFESQVVFADLQSSGITPPEAERTFLNNRFYIPKDSPDRSLSGITINYSPKWTPNLYLGYSQTSYAKNIEGSGSSRYFKVFQNILKGGNRFNQYYLPENHSSVFFKYVFPKSGSEVYGEYGLKEQSWNVSNIIRALDMNDAFMVGFSQYVKLSSKNWDLLEIAFELTSLQQSPFRVINSANSWYIDDQIREGYTHKGEVIGAAIGPGSNSQYFHMALVKGMNRLQVHFERSIHNNDFYYYTFTQSQDNRRFWTDLNPGLSYAKETKKLVFSVEASFVRSLNYQWILNQFEGQPYFINGKDVNNLECRAQLTYKLK